jgi:dCTP diphosphatase
MVVPMDDVIDKIPTLVSTINEFAETRSWTKYHTPRNLVMALIGEVGELAELQQFKGEDEKPGVEDLDKLSQEIADVSIYLLRLASVCRAVPTLCNELKRRQK